MKLRVRRLPNDKWVCEAKRWWHPWRGVQISTWNCRGGVQRYITTYAHGDGCFAWTWHDSNEAAIRVFVEANSILGR